MVADLSGKPWNKAGSGETKLVAGPVYDLLRGSSCHDSPPVKKGRSGAGLRPWSKALLIFFGFQGRGKLFDLILQCFKFVFKRLVLSGELS